MLGIRDLFLSTLNILIFFSIFYFIFKINYTFRIEELFGSQVFLTEIIAPNAFPALIKFSIFIAGCIIFLTLFNKLMMKYKNIFSEFSQTKTLMIILGISFFIKMMILGFNIDTNDDVKNTIDKVFINGEFNAYKLYNYLAYATYLLTDNYNFYLYIINIIFSVITIGILYLIFSRFLEKDSSLFIIIFLSLLCIPLTSIAAYLRVDSMYILLFTSTFYYLIKIIQDNNHKDFMKLLLILVLSCLCRESTLYMLPLFIFILLFSKHHKTKYILASSFIVLIMSMLISSANLKNYGMKSKYKEFHLLVKAMQYGYLNEKNIESYKNNLSNNAQILLNDINKSYKTFVPPHKREIFSGVPPYPSRYWDLIRPDAENIETKSRVTPYKGNLEIVVQDYITLLNKGPTSVTEEDLAALVNVQSLKYNNIDDKNLLAYTVRLLLELFLIAENKVPSSIGLCQIGLNDRLSMEYKTSCVISILQGTEIQWMLMRSDNSSYFLATLPYSWTFDEETKKYKQHPKIQSITEIILKIPILYVTQSLLTMTTMSGYHPSPSGLIKKSGVYKSSVLPNIILINVQKYIGLIINFWYIFCAYVFFHSLFNKNIHSRNLKIIISLIPIYYGLFTSFATFGEFYRLMLVVVPLILYNYLIVLNILYNSLKNIITFFFQSNKLSQP
tara:strand:- start:575 stop:2587 length:2013 start_codon:yes stop_codon:yes gene_type:complete